MRIHNTTTTEWINALYYTLPYCITLLQPLLYVRKQPCLLDFYAHIAYLLLMSIDRCVKTLYDQKWHLKKSSKFWPFTVWKFHDFLIIQILREFNFGDWKSANFDILTLSEALNFNLYEYLHFWRLKYIKSTKFRTPKMAKWPVFELLNYPKLILHKIWMTEKSWNFHTMPFINQTSVINVICEHIAVLQFCRLT